MKRFLMLLVGAVLAIASMQMSAQAAMYDLGDITGTSGDTYGGALGFFQPPTPINDSVKFTLSDTAVVTGTLSNIVFFIGPFPLLDISGLTLKLGATVLTLDPSGNFSIPGMLAAGDYFLTITGTTAGFFGGAYNIAVTATTPIPGALLLFMTAIGGMAGFAGLRRRGSTAA